MDTDSSVDVADIPTELQRTLPSSAYLGAGAFEAERERIFFREWFCVGRQESLPAGGDFLEVDVAGERVLVVRTREDGLRACFNVCRHRGSRLVPEDATEAAPERRRGLERER